MNQPHTFDHEEFRPAPQSPIALAAEAVRAKETAHLQQPDTPRTNGKVWVTERDDAVVDVTFAHELERESATTTAKVKELEQAQYVPGLWYCRTCGFIQQRSVLNMGSGTISADTEIHMDPCPNDGDVMFPRTWKQLAEGQERTIRTVIDDKIALQESAISANTALMKSRQALERVVGYANLKPGPLGDCREALDLITAAVVGKEGA